ncbi:MAG: HAMP domain-containing histidine kinase, partial [Gemmatimonadetes bacterium]|nr:HAMP domain-containing histidine kinase [Gemmatimonadota bacterium]
MNYSALAAASSTILLLFVAFVLGGISRAPGWERTRAFAWVSVTAAAYAAGDLLTVSGEVPHVAQLWASRGQFVVGSLHAAAWLAFAYDPNDGPPRRRILVLQWLSYGMAALGMIPGFALDAASRVIRVPSIGVTYTMFPLTLVGSVGGALMLVGIAVAFVRVARAGWGGSRLTEWAKVGFGAFYVCAAVDFATASGFVEFVPLAGVGFLVALMPVAVYMIRAFVRNAHRLERLSRDLSLEVQARTNEVVMAQRALADAERHASIGRVAAGVAHDINNPLAWLVLNADLLRDFGTRHPLPAEATESIDGIVDGAERIKAAVEALRARTRWSPGMRVAVAPDRLVRVALKAVATELHQSHDVSVDLGATPLVLGDEGELMGAFSDLISQAQRVSSAMPGVAQVRVESGTGPDGWATFLVSARRSTVASGALDLSTLVIADLVGLDAARHEFERHGGTMQVDSGPDHWTAVVRLPPSGQLVTPEGRIATLAVASL